MKKKFLALFASAVLAMSFGAPGATAAEKGQWQQTSDGNWQYLETDSSGAAQKATGWREIDGKWYYFNTASDKGTLGAMLANTTTPDGYQVDANGAWIR